MVVDPPLSFHSHSSCPSFCPLSVYLLILVSPLTWVFFPHERMLDPPLAPLSPKVPLYLPSLLHSPSSSTSPSSLAFFCLLSLCFPLLQLRKPPCIRVRTRQPRLFFPNLRFRTPSPPASLDFLQTKHSCLSLSLSLSLLTICSNIEKSLATSPSPSLLPPPPF
jgi:hypothetical protein